MSPENSNNTRSGQRLPFVVQVQLRWQGGTLSAYCTDISTSGIFLRTTQDIELGESVEMVFSIFVDGSRQPVDLKGTVARRLTSSEAGAQGTLPGLGIHFSRVSPGRDKLFRFLTSKVTRLQQEGTETQPSALQPEVRPAAPAKSESTASGAKRPVPLRSKSSNSLPVRWGTSSDLKHKGFLHGSSSSSSVLIETIQTLSVGTHVFLWFQLPLSSGPRAVKATGKVARALEQGKRKISGLEIKIELATLDTQLISSYLGRRQQEIEDTSQEPEVMRKELADVMNAAVESTDVDMQFDIKRKSSRSASSVGQRLLIAALIGCGGALLATWILIKFLI